MRRDDPAYFFDILESALAIRKYLSGCTAKTFEEDDMRQDAVIRRITIIGEAAKHISKEAKKRWPNVPYDAMYLMRNLIVHDYSHVDPLEVWNAATESVPELIEIVTPIIDELRS